MSSHQPLRVARNLALATTLITSVAAAQSSSEQTGCSSSGREGRAAQV